MTTVFLDESGFTGSNLCDPNQPIFSLASHCLLEEESREVKDRFFGGFSGRELKYSKLSKRSSTQKMILDFMAFLRGREQDTRIAYAHKPFVLLCKGIDLIVEPNMYRCGIDLYEQGGNLVMANMIHYMTIDLAGQEYYSRLLKALQDFIHEPNQKSHGELCDVLVEKTGECGSPKYGPLATMLRILYFAVLTMHFEDTSQLSSSQLEFAFSQTIVVMNSWKERLGPGMTLIHDATAAMSRKKDFWDKLMSPEAPADIIGYDRRTMEFPIGISKTRFEASGMYVGLQLADVLAGAVRECMTYQIIPEKDREPFAQDLWSRLDGWVLASTIWPEAKFNPQELGTEGSAASDGIKYMEHILRSVD